MSKRTSEKSARPKVSVVVPIYNVEKYLRECVDSILGQTLKDIEVILVDDGSPDNSGKIIDEYAKKDKRVVPIHKENGGYSKAVNYGISIAKGEYIGIIESDDWIEPDMYELLYIDAKKYDTDITKAEFYKYNSTVIGSARNWRFTTHGRAVDLDNAPDTAFHITDFPQIIAFHASIWSCIYRANFVKKIKLADTAGASYQDFPFMVETMTKAKRISVVKKPLVHWRVEPGQSNSTSQKGKKLLLMAENTLRSYDILRGSGYYDELKEAFFAQAIWANADFLYVINDEYREEYFEQCKKIFAPLKQDKHFMFKYFSDGDAWLVNEFMNRSWKEYLSDCKRGFKQRLHDVLMRLSPKYRSIEYTKALIREESEVAKETARIDYEIRCGRW